jgi:hypothetical protein
MSHAAPLEQPCDTTPFAGDGFSFRCDNTIRYLVKLVYDAGRLAAAVGSITIAPCKPPIT